jgi:hypothetical protein
MLQHKEVNHIQQGCFARGETEAVEIDLDMSMTLLIGMDQAKRRQGSTRLPSKKNRIH